MTGHDADVAGRGARDDQGGLAGPDTAVSGDQLDMQLSSLHRGCIPTKALLHAGEIADQARESEQFGVKATLE
ncbi:hypothetical protein ACWGBX_39305, partial [Streptomyces sp. NPDC055037]